MYGWFLLESLVKPTKTQTNLHAAFICKFQNLNCDEC